MEESLGSDALLSAKRIPFKRTLHLRTPRYNVGDLKSLGRMLNKIQRMSLSRKYGRILDLLEVDVQTDAQTALAQYYDSPLRCFTFADFQLVPTLEEYG